MGPDIDDVFWVPKDGHILNEGEAVLCHPELPSYQPHGISFANPLTLTDCHLAIEKIISQTRLIVFEIARKQIPFFKRGSRKIKLQGSPRIFDIILAEITEGLDHAFAVDSLEKVTYRLLKMLENHVKAHNDFGASSGT